MRIVAGEWKGRRLATAKGTTLRPTPERVREAWMSILQVELPGSRVLDLFAGTGALGLEALSRGAGHSDFVENDPRSVRTLLQNIHALGAADRCTVHRAEALAFASRLASSGPTPAAPHDADARSHAPYDICFADPPYRRGLAADLAAIWLAAPFSAIFGVEHASADTVPDGGDRRRYGDTAITIYRT